MANRILVAGYYGFDNAGDELILTSLVNELKRLNSKIEIYVLSNDPFKTGKRYGVKALNRWNILSIILAILRTDLFVFGGGGLLQDLTSGWSIYYYLGLISLGKLFFKRVVLISQGVGPVRSKFGRKATGIVLRLADLITVRDEASKFELVRLNGNLSVSIAPDPALNLDRFGFRIGEHIPSEPDARPIIGVSIQGFGKGERFKETFKEICDEIVKKIKPKIVLIPFHRSEDLKISRYIAANREGDYELFLWEEVEDLFEFYNKIDLILGMRLHSIILACLFGKPFVAISLPKNDRLYDPKIGGFLELLGCEVMDVAVPAPIIATKVHEILRGRQKFLEEIGPRVARLKDASRENIRILQNLLEKIP